MNGGMTKMEVGVGGHSLFAVAIRIYCLERQIQGARFVHAAAPVVQRRRTLSRGSRVGILAIDIARGQGRFAGNLRSIGHAERLT